MTTYYKATFSDGTVLRRSTTSRKYTHAYLTRQNLGAARDWQQDGFCSSERLARKQHAASRNWGATFAEIAPAIEITRKEYLELA